ncbi:MAG: substrate-binding domain-containing protein [Spirochaetaceae bacterium]
MLDTNQNRPDNKTPVLWVTEEKEIPIRPEHPELLPENDSDHWYDLEYAGWGEKKINIPKSPANGPKGKNITCLMPGHIHPYMIAYEHGMKAIADKFRINLTFKYSEWGDDEQQQQVYQTISENPDLIIIIPNSSDTSSLWFQDINKAGIPVIASNLLPESGGFKYLLSWTGPDDWQQSRVLARKFAKLMDNKGGYAIVCHLDGCSAYYSRKWGVVSELHKIAPDMEVLEMGSSNLDTEETYKMTKIWLEKYGDKLNGIFCSDDSNVQLGVNKAISEMGRSDVTCVAIGSTNTGMRLLKDGSLDAITFQKADLDGALPIQVAVDWFNGLKVSPLRYLPIHILTKNNVSDFVFNYDNPEEIDTDYLLRMIIECNRDGVSIFFSSIITKFSSMGVLSIDYFKGFSIELLSSLINIVKSNKLSEKDVIGDYETIFKKLFNQQSTELTLEWLKEVSLTIVDEIQSSIKVTPSLIKQVVEYVNDNFTKPISLKTISNTFENSAAYIGRLFKEETGESFSKYLNRLRIEKAKELLLNSNVKANKVAIQVGYGDPNYFYITFKKFTGLFPSEYLHSLK